MMMIIRMMVVITMMSVGVDGHDNNGGGGVVCLWGVPVRGGVEDVTQMSLMCRRSGRGGSPPPPVLPYYPSLNKRSSPSTETAAPKTVVVASATGKAMHTSRTFHGRKILWWLSTGEVETLDAGNVGMIIFCARTKGVGAGFRWNAYQDLRT